MKTEDKQFWKAASLILLYFVLYFLLAVASTLLLPMSAGGAEVADTLRLDRELGMRQAQVNAVAWCLWTEARGETLEGKTAVMSVLLNRADRSGKSLVCVVFKRKQFSGVGRYVPDWFVGGPDGITWPAKYDNQADCKAFFECYNLAIAAVSGDFEPTGPWTHYYAYRDCSPYWASGLSEVRIIGNHRFGITK